MIQLRRYPDVDLFPTPAISEAGWKPLGSVPSSGTLFRDLWGRGRVKPKEREEAVKSVKGRVLWQAKQGASI